MALQAGQVSKKTLQLRCTRATYTNKDDGTTKAYNQYSVVVNGIPIRLQVPVKDNTARLILEEYFNE